MTTPAGATPTLESTGAVHETERLILDAGAACLARFGNEKTSIQDVADAAGVSRATVYRYFTDRAQLLQAVTDYEHHKQLGEVRTRAAGAETLEQALAVIAEVAAAAALRFHTREHLRNRDRGLAQYLFLQSTNRLESVRDLVYPYVSRAHASGELDPTISLDDAVEWIVLTISMIPTLPGSSTLDLDDPVALGAAFARRLCRGLSNT